jgi:hypothetical protein
MGPGQVPLALAAALGAAWVLPGLGAIAARPDAGQSGALSLKRDRLPHFCAVAPRLERLYMTDCVRASLEGRAFDSTFWR